MKNLKNALLLKQLYHLKQLGYTYTSVVPFKENEPDLKLPNTLETLKKQATECHLCILSKSRNKVVFGEGHPHAKLMIVADVPSDNDDINGRIFTGRSGELLTKMLENVLELSREDVYITNLLKCHALDSHSPSPANVHTCYPYVLKEIELVKPSMILSMGELAYSYLSNDDTPLEKVRGSTFVQEQYTLIPTYHPNYLLRNPSAKKEVFADLLKLKGLL
ncbi:MAG: Uracil-DNA glycosylase, family 4 [uncultured Sulfurovum sp.]|uniref:Type-4 uracil-DNA glycosylase n=1 Tax=uncultured Sulfurovum sp. TaxID=269237 RepID=A0A6S6S7R1_9BACT|nr:MAG: Uracil-DNA glycosylase, family 4 [uncultured Sulfurovum sp.]